jgi:hypothetical protein
MAEHEPSIGQSDDWHTPSSIFDALGLEFDLDPCAPIDRTFYFVPAVRVFTKVDDGLVPAVRLPARACAVVAEVLRARRRHRDLSRLHL